jgi:hypothetical protein
MSATKAVISKDDPANGIVSKALFIPLKREWFEAFKNGRKFREMRPYGPRWNHKTCYVGRRVVISMGYGKQHRLNGTIIDFEKSQSAHRGLWAWDQIYGPDIKFSACIGIALDDAPEDYKTPDAPWGEREGPSIIEGRAWFDNRQPMRRNYSCLGCRHLKVDPEYNSNLCTHPTMVAKHEVPQWITQCDWALLDRRNFLFSSCPILNAARINHHPRCGADWREGVDAMRRVRPEEEKAMFSLRKPVDDYFAPSPWDEDGMNR